MGKRQWKLAIASVVLALGSIGICAFAGQQQGGPRGGRGGGGPERQLQMLTERLSLTADQQTGVKAVLVQQSEQMKALRQKSQDEGAADSADARQARMKQMQQIRDESDTKISALLDDTQKRTFADMLAKRKARMEQRQQGGGDGTPPPNDGGAPPNGK
jgi:Spy/CpxP family protein refolding chaperone